MSHVLAALMPFQSTPSTRRVTTHKDLETLSFDISIHTLHTEGDPLFSPPFLVRLISIHTLHTEGDLYAFWITRDQNISIHTLHTEGDFQLASDPHLHSLFQSTPSTRRVTGEKGGAQGQIRISIHTLHTEGDTPIRTIPYSHPNFNPHPPHGG